MARSNQVLNGGQVIVDYLIREKVPYAFGLCGMAISGLSMPYMSAPTR